MRRTEQPADPTDGPPLLRQPLLPIPGAQPSLRACLLSGGSSRRMGRDKALLPHPEGGCWLERTLLLLLELEIPVTLLSRHPHHLQLARALPRPGLPAAAPEPLQRSCGPACSGNPASATPAGRAAPVSGPQAGEEPPGLTAIAESEPWQGPLLALHRLMQRYPDQRLLLCPVDMPWLRLEVLQSLLRAADEQPQRIHLAHDGERRQPLLGIYPSPAELRADLNAALGGGERRLQGWLAGQDCREVQLDPAALHNVNTPEALAFANTGCHRAGEILER